MSGIFGRQSKKKQNHCHFHLLPSLLSLGMKTKVGRPLPRITFKYFLVPSECSTFFFTVKDGVINVNSSHYLSVIFQCHSTTGYISPAGGIKIVKTNQQINKQTVVSAVWKNRPIHLIYSHVGAANVHQDFSGLAR